MISAFCRTSSINLQNHLHANLKLRVRMRILTVYQMKLTNITPFNHDFHTLRGFLRKHMISKLHKIRTNNSRQSKLAILVAKQGVRSPVPPTVWVCLRRQDNRVDVESESGAPSLKCSHRPVAAVPRLPRTHGWFVQIAALGAIMTQETAEIINDIPNNPVAKSWISYMRGNVGLVLTNCCMDAPVCQKANNGESG